MTKNNLSEPPIGSKSLWEKVSSIQSVKDAINHDAGIKWLERGGGVSTAEQQIDDYKKAEQDGQNLFNRLIGIPTNRGSERR